MSDIRYKWNDGVDSVQISHGELSSFNELLMLPSTTSAIAPVKDK